MSDITLGPALRERTALAIEAEVRRHTVVADLYMSMVREVFAVTDGRSPNLSFLDRPSVPATALSDDARRAEAQPGGRDATTRASSVSASAPGDAVGRPAGGGLP